MLTFSLFTLSPVIDFSCRMSRKNIVSENSVEIIENIKKKHVEYWMSIHCIVECIFMWSRAESIKRAPLLHSCKPGPIICVSSYTCIVCIRLWNWISNAALSVYSINSSYHKWNKSVFATFLVFFNKQEREKNAARNLSRTI